MRFESQTLKYRDLKLKQFKHIKLSHNLAKIVIIILYNHYLPKISELKNQVSKLIFKI
jgi:hypothetical protein